MGVFRNIFGAGYDTFLQKIITIVILWYLKTANKINSGGGG